ncbi:MAG: ribose-5-phosphate isomerase RpiA [Bacteroidia bacterium]|nr:ribose-5-phosphate isomerase RpiA [Bacteroidia bacterium]
MNPKQIVGEKASEYVQNGMKVGLGTGSTAYFMVMKLGERVRNEGLDIIGIPTSRATEELAQEQGIKLATFEEVQDLDLTIDGADEFNPDLQLIKGGGGALLREKLVASISRKLIVITDARKQVNVLGKFPLPIEVVRFGWEITFERLKALRLNPILRMEGEEAFITDNSNYILDCHVGEIHDPASLHEELKSMLGVVETGLFIDMASEVIMADNEGNVQIFSK